MPIESTRRHPKFDDKHSVPVQLSDGQFWFIPKPWYEIRPIFQDGLAVDYNSCFTHGSELDDLIETISASDDFALRTLASVGLAAYLLKRNYDLSDEDLSDILIYRAGDPQSELMLREIIDVAMGLSGKKHSPAGDDLP